MLSGVLELKDDINNAEDFKIQSAALTFIKNWYCRIVNILVNQNKPHKPNLMLRMISCGFSIFRAPPNFITV